MNSFKWSLLALLLSFLAGYTVQVLNAHPRSQNVYLQISRCSQDIVDFRKAGLDGVRFASNILERMISATNENQLNVVNSECRAFSEAHDSSEFSREEQLVELLALKPNLNPRVYYFLRGAIRPLIVCYAQSYSIDSVCISTTGKSWREIRVNSPGELVQYRLGHSDGITVRGPQNYFNDEDRLLIQSLPSDFSGSALSYLPNELTRNFSHFRMLPGANTTRFIHHFFPESVTR